MDLSNVIAFRTNKTIYRDGDTVIKVFGEGFKKADILNEALNHARVEETALHIPKLYGVGMTEERKWYILTEFVPAAHSPNSWQRTRKSTRPIWSSSSICN